MKKSIFLLLLFFPLASYAYEIDIPDIPDVPDIDINIPDIPDIDMGVSGSQNRDKPRNTIHISPTTSMQVSENERVLRTPTRTYYISDQMLKFQSPTITWLKNLLDGSMTFRSPTTNWMYDANGDTNYKTPMKTIIKSQNKISIKTPTKTFVDEAGVIYYKTPTKTLKIDKDKIYYTTPTTKKVIDGKNWNYTTPTKSYFN